MVRQGARPETNNRTYGPEPSWTASSSWSVAAKESPTSRPRRFRVAGRLDDALTLLPCSKGLTR
jgi:hypothetical protein